MKTRRKLQDFMAAEQDPGKDLFAILFLTFYLLFLLTMVAGSSEPGGGGHVRGGDIVVIAKQATGIVFRVGDRDYDPAAFHGAVSGLPVFGEADGNRYLRITAGDTLSAIEWEREKKRLRQKGFSISTFVAETDG